jgi:hypothetical protein
MIITSNHAYAQQIGTIGLGDITYGVANGANEGKNVLDALNSDIYDALTKTRKFGVLDYSQVVARLKKQNRTLRGYYSKEYSGNAVWQEGLDFILKAKVSQFKLAKRQQENREIGIGKIKIDFQLYGVADVTYDLTSSVSTQFVMPFNSGDKNASKMLLNKTIQKAVDHLVDDIISSLFTIQIVKITDEGVITLNYGNGLLEVGDSVIIYPLETDTIIDEAGEAIDGAVATIKVTSTALKLSLAQMPEVPEDLVLEKGQKGRLVLANRDASPLRATGNSNKR